MGDPRYYYREFLQNLAYYLFISEDKDLAVRLLSEKSISVLENHVLKKKLEMMGKDFYYAAGMAVEHVVKRVCDEDGTDGFNACAGGLCEFEHFIGIHEDDDD